MLDTMKLLHAGVYTAANAIMTLWRIRKRLRRLRPGTYVEYEYCCIEPGTLDLKFRKAHGIIVSIKRNGLLEPDDCFIYDAAEALNPEQFMLYGLGPLGVGVVCISSDDVRTL